MPTQSERLDNMLTFGNRYENDNQPIPTPRPTAALADPPPSSPDQTPRREASVFGRLPPAVFITNRDFLSDIEARFRSIGRMATSIFHEFYPTVSCEGQLTYEILLACIEAMENNSVRLNWGGVDASAH